MENKKSDIFNGSKFENEKVKDVLEACYKHGHRVRIFYGNDSKVWNESYDVLGTIGRSTGDSKIALLIHNKNSLGGGGILTDCIIGIFNTEDHSKYYWDDNYKMPTSKVFKSDGEKYNLFLDDELHATGTAKQMIRLADFMTGRRMGK